MIVCFRDGQTMERVFWDWHELYEKKWDVVEMSVLYIPTRQHHSFLDVGRKREDHSTATWLVSYSKLGRTWLI